MLVAKREKIQKSDNPHEEEQKFTKWNITAQTKYEQTKKYRRIYVLAQKIINFDNSLIETALKSLKHHTKIISNKQFNTVSNEDFNIICGITLSKAIPENFKEFYTVMLKLSESLFSIESTKVCIFVKKIEKQIQEKIEKSIYTKRKQVFFVELDKMQEIYKNQQKFTNFCNSYDIFLCDQSIYSELPRMLKEFLGKRSNKCPYAIPISENWEETVYEQIYNKTYLTIRRSGKFSFCIGKLTSDSAKLAQNIISACYQAIPHILCHAEKHTSIQEISIKTANSIELPIYKKSTKSNEN